MPSYFGPDSDDAKYLVVVADLYIKFRAPVTYPDELLLAIGIAPEITDRFSMICKVCFFSVEHCT